MQILLTGKANIRRQDAIQKLSQYDCIDEIEDSGMDDGRFFVHLHSAYDWNIDARENRRTESFGTISECKAALKKVIPATRFKKWYK